MYYIYAVTLRPLVGNRRNMAISLSYPFGSWTDISEQIDTELASFPVCMVEGQMTPEQAEDIHVNPDYLVVGFKEVDDVTKVVVDTDLNTTLSTGQQNQMRAWFTSKWPAVPSKVTNKIVTGNSRSQTMVDLIGILRRVNAQ